METTHKEPQPYGTYTSMAMYFLCFSGPKMLLPLEDPFLLRSSLKSTQSRPKRWMWRPARGEADEELEGHTSGVPGCGEQSGAASPQPPEASGAFSSGTA